MSWLAWVGVVTCTLIILYVAYRVFEGLDIAEDDFEDGGHR